MSGTSRSWAASVASELHDRQTAHIYGGSRRSFGFDAKGDEEELEYDRYAGEVFRVATVFQGKSASCIVRSSPTSAVPVPCKDTVRIGGRNVQVTVPSKVLVPPVAVPQRVEHVGTVNAPEAVTPDPVEERQAIEAADRGANTPLTRAELVAVLSGRGSSSPQTSRTPQQPSTSRIGAVQPEPHAQRGSSTMSRGDRRKLKFERKGSKLKGALHRRRDELVRRSENAFESAELNFFSYFSDVPVELYGYRNAYRVRRLIDVAGSFSEIVAIERYLSAVEERLARAEPREAQDMTRMSAK